MIIGEAFIEISPTDKRFEQLVVRQANAAAKKAANELADVPVSADATKLDASVVAAAKAAARKATKELQDIPGGVDAAEFERRVTAAANDAAAKAAAKLANIPAGVDVATLEADAANAAAKAATAAASRLDDIPLGVDGAELVRDVDHAMDQAERRVDTGARRMRDDTGSALGGLGGLVAKSFAAIGVAQLVFGGVADVRAARAEARQTENVIRSTGGAAQVTAKQVDNLTTSIRAKTQVDDDEVRAGANLLLTFTNVRNEVGRGNDIFNQATLTLVDMAKAMGTDTTAGAIQLGKALNDPIAGVSALAEVGVTFTAQQKDQIRTMVEAGNVAGAQKVILAELRKEFGGSAAAQADDLDRLALKYDDFKERVGAGVLQVIGVLSDIPKPLQLVGVGLGGLAVAAVGVSKVVDAVGSLREGVQGLSAAHPQLGATIGKLGLIAGAATGLVAATTSILGSIERMNDVRVDVPNLQRQLAERFDLRTALRNASPELLGKLREDFDRLGESTVRLGSAGERGSDRLKRSLDDLDKSLAGLVAGGALATAKDRVRELAEEMDRSPEEVLVFLDDYRTALDQSEAQAATAAAAERERTGATKDGADATKAAAVVTYDAAAALARQEQELKDVAAGLDNFRTALDKAIGIQVNSQQAAITYIDTVQRLRDSVTEHGKTLDLNSDAGRRNREAILAVISSAKEHVTAMAEEGATADEVRATFATHRTELERVLGQLGLNKEESAKYLAILKDVPGSVFTNLQVKDAEGLTKVRSFIQVLDKELGTERVITIKVDPVTGVTTRTTGPVLREHGGPVYRGSEYLTGERRPEWYEPSGWVFPSPPATAAATPRVVGRGGPELFTPPASGRVLPQVPAWASGLGDEELRRRLAELQRSTWRSVPRAASGAIVQPSPGGTLVQVAEAGQAEAIIPLPPGLVAALERLATAVPATSAGLFRDLVVQGATAEGAFATGQEVVRQMRAEHVRSTGGGLFT